MKQYLFIKYSNERSRKFAVKTEIRLEDGKRIVEKTALYPEGKEHVHQLLHWHEVLKNQYQKVGWDVNHCTQSEEGVHLRYEEGMSLENLLDEYLTAGNVTAAEAKLIWYLEQIKSIHEEKEFCLSESFYHVFGMDDQRDQYFRTHVCHGTDVSNLDMVCSNLILQETPVVLDYEWTFDFMIPCSFLIFRVIHYYIESNAIRRVLQKQELLQRFGITAELASIYENMEAGFQKYITGECVPTRELYNKICPGIKSVREYREGNFQIYFALHNKESEQNSQNYLVRENEIDMTFPIPEDCTFLRIDPCDGPCVVEFLEYDFDGKESPLVFEVRSGGELHGKMGYFPYKDPGFTKICFPKGTKTFHLKLKIYETTEPLVKKILQDQIEKEKAAHKISVLETKIQRLTSQITDMKNTKVWKAYQSYRDVVERKKK